VLKALRLRVVRRNRTGPQLLPAPSKILHPWFMLPASSGIVFAYLPVLGRDQWSRAPLLVASLPALGVCLDLRTRAPG
jgi:hypothetical protein